MSSDGDDAMEETIVVDRTRPGAASGDDDLERTVVRPGRRRRAAAVPPADADDDVERTIVVDRGVREADDDDAERTILVDRAPREVDDDDDDAERTILVDRAPRPDDDERTILVERGPRLLGLDDDDDDTGRTERPHDEFDIDTDSDRTVARPRADADDDETITVDRGSPTVSLPPVPSLRPARVQRRRGIAPPPIPVGFAPAARPAVGPGAVDHYRPRELRPAPAVAPVSAGGAASARAFDPTLPSVVRRSRRTAAVAVTAFVGTCAVSVTGLTLIVLWAL